MEEAAELNKHLQLQVVFHQIFTILKAERAIAKLSMTEELHYLVNYWNTSASYRADFLDFLKLSCEYGVYRI